ncbi:MAG: hypothetical protein U0234_08680 [Sandaracinus sp.]
MTRTLFLSCLFVTAFASAACSTTSEHPHQDTGVAPGDDAGTSPGTDAWVTPGTDAWAPGLDAWVAPGDDAGSGSDPLNAAPTCTSNANWTSGNRGSQLMNPGLACIACHDTDFRAPSFSVAGTVYPTGHEPDRCNGINGIANGVTVDVTDANGTTVTLNVNRAGNFFYEGSLTPPFTASVSYQGRVRHMVGAQTSGDCNACHTQNGASAAPGRITVP